MTRERFLEWFVVAVVVLLLIGALAAHWRLVSLERATVERLTAIEIEIIKFEREFRVFHPVKHAPVAKPPGDKED